MARYTYRHFQSGDRHITICYSRYAGQPISGKAVCAPEDNASDEIGEILSRARLDEKVQKIRVRNHKDVISNCESLIGRLQEMIEREKVRLERDTRVLEECKDTIHKYCVNHDKEN